MSTHYMSQLCVQGASSPLGSVVAVRWIRIRDYKPEEGGGEVSQGASGGGEKSLAVVPLVAIAMETDPQQLLGARVVAMPADLLDCPSCRVPLKAEEGGGEMSQVAGGGGEKSLAVVPLVAIAMETDPQQLVGARVVAMPADLLDCHSCRVPLKPPIFKCDDEHLVCSSCRGVHGEACGRAVGHSALAEAFAAAATVPCGYERYGCDAGGVVYHEAADHRRACQHAPCYCPDRAGAAGIASCGFTGSRQMLLDHISGPDHSRPIIVVRYGQPWNLSLPLSRRWHVLVGEEDKAAAAPGSNRHRNLFLVSLGERGATTAVSLVCVRADGTAPGAPQFACKLAVEHSGDGTRLTLESPRVSSSSLAGGVPAPGEVKCLPVPKDFLSSDSVPLTIHIEKLASPPPPLTSTPPTAATPPPPPPPPLTSTPPTAATPPPCPAAAVLSLPASATAAVKPVTTDQSNKKRKSTNPRKLKTICMSDLV